MGTAHMADAPVILVGILTGAGVFAFLVGTLELLDEGQEQGQGFIINKFRGTYPYLGRALVLEEDRSPCAQCHPLYEGYLYSGRGWGQS